MTATTSQQNIDNEHHIVFRELHSSKNFQKVWEESKLPSNFKLNEHTPLSVSCAGGNYDAVQYFIKQKVDVNDRATLFGYTPLMFASEIAHFNIIKLLLDNGADTGTFGRQAKSAPLVLLISNYENKGNKHDYWKCTDLLLENTSHRYHREALEETYYRDFKEVFLHLFNTNIIPFETISRVISPLIKQFSSTLDLKREIHKIWLTKEFYDKLGDDLSQNTNFLINKMKI